MTAAAFIRIDADPRDYAWGQIDGVAHARGRELRGAREAELWLGAHPDAPSRATVDAEWHTLDEWERVAGERLPFLMKILSAAQPLSLQAHPSPAQAREGFARENAAGIPRDAPNRNYRDAFAKPEMIVALHDGFEALCGFRGVDEVAQDIDELRGVLGDEHAAALGTWEELLRGPDGIRRAFLWLLSDDDTVAALVAAVSEHASAHPRLALLGRIASFFPGDPGVLGALMLRHVTLANGEALWLPAGNIHAYLFGTGIELMGPSDNVLRGGLTGKHIDTAELGRVMDATPSGDAHLVPASVSEGILRFRPEEADEAGFQLFEAHSGGLIATPSAAIALVTEGAFTLSAGDASIDLDRGDIVFVTAGADLQLTGAGRLFLATGA